MGERDHGLGRREFLALGAGLGGAGLLLGGEAAFGRPLKPLSRVPRRGIEGRGAAKNVILLVADGMSAGTLALAEYYANRVEGRSTVWATALRESAVRRCAMATHSADSVVTDSAAGASAWATGRKVNNGSICYLPDATPATPLMLRAKANDKATGLVTTTRVTHATPAAFIANVPLRALEDAIGAQTLERGVDVVLGGGAKHFPARLTGATGVRTVRTAQELERVRAEGLPGDVRTLLGLFHESHVPYVLDRTDEHPSLDAMTRTALALLEPMPNGFLLMVEGGRVDHAGHANDAGAIVREQLEFDRTLGIALDFANRRDDTLVVATTDHGCGGTSLTVYGPDADTGLASLAGVRRSFEWIEGEINAKGLGRDPVGIADLLQYASGVELDDDARHAVASVVRGERVNPFSAQNLATSAFGSVLANAFGVAFVSPNHTAEFVEVLATGPGSERLPDLIDNTLLHGLMVDALDLAPANARD